jgi:uncharacterized membrane protein YfcA
MICSTAGLVAGLFGIGGGVVKGPLMLELGVAPDVSTDRIHGIRHDHCATVPGIGVILVVLCQLAARRVLLRSWLECVHVIG